MKITVIGPGAMGLLFGGKLAACADVTLVGNNPKNLKEIKDTSGWKESYKDSVTSDFVSYLKSQPLLKGILAGHLHFDVQDRFSPSAMEYVVGGNFLFHGQEVTIS